MYVNRTCSSNGHDKHGIRYKALSKFPWLLNLVGFFTYIDMPYYVKFASGTYEYWNLSEI